MYELLHSFIQQLFPHCQVDVARLEPLLESRIVLRDFLFQEGDLCDFVGLTLKGCLRSFFLKDGKELTLFFHPEHHTLGDYESFRRQTPAYFSCQAIEDSEILILTTQAIAALETMPDGQKLLRLVVESLAFQLRDRLLSLHRDSPEQQYLNFLKSEPQLLQRIPQHYLASHLGIEPESSEPIKAKNSRETIDLTQVNARYSSTQ